MAAVEQLVAEIKATHDPGDRLAVSFLDSGSFSFEV
jgi:hypothetical protein